MNARRSLYAGAPVPESPIKDLIRAVIISALDDAVAISRGDALHFDTRCRPRPPCPSRPNGGAEYSLRVLQAAGRDLMEVIHSREFRGWLHLSGVPESEIDNCVRIVIGIARGWMPQEGNKIQHFLHPWKAKDAEKEATTRAN